MLRQAMSLFLLLILSLAIGQLHYVEAIEADDVVVVVIEEDGTRHQEDETSTDNDHEAEEVHAEPWAVHGSGRLVNPLNFSSLDRFVWIENYNYSHLFDLLRPPSCLS
jgi:hypothetical protein